jgi:hypothetical protein
MARSRSRKIRRRLTPNKSSYRGGNPSSKISRKAAAHSYNVGAPGGRRVGDATMESMGVSLMVDDYGMLIISDGTGAGAGTEVGFPIIIDDRRGDPLP